AIGDRLLRGEAPLVYGDGRQTRDSTYIANAVLASPQARASRRPLAGAGINAGTGRQTSVRQLADTMAALIGSPPTGAVEPEFRPERAGDVRHSLADISRARELLGYEPFATLEVGLEETIRWFQQGGLPHAAPEVSSASARPRRPASPPASQDTGRSDGH